MTLAQRLSAAGSAAVVLCAVVLTALVVRRELFSAPPRSAPREQVVADWRSYAAEGRRTGPADAPVTVVVFSDFQCPACRMLAESLDSVTARRPGQVAVVYRHFPLSSVHPYATAAARASECAAGQGRFEAFHDALFREQALLGIQPWRSFAAGAGVADLDAFDRCVAGTAPDAAILRDGRAGERLRVTGTPTVLINQHRFQGAPPLAELERQIERALRG